MEIELDKIEGLPTLPTVYAEVETLCQDPNVDANKLAQVIESDPSITMKLLKLSNSAFFGFNRQIRSVKDRLCNVYSFALDQLAVTSEDLMSWEEGMVQTMEKDMAFLAVIA